MVVVKELGYSQLVSYLDGTPKSITAQAFARFARVNIYGIDHERAKNVMHRTFQMSEAKSAWHKELRDPNATEEDRAKASEHYREILIKMSDDLGQYLKDSEIYPNLKVK